MRRTPVFLLLLVALSFGLRIFLLGSQELRGDEGFSWNYIQGSPDIILHRIIAEGDPQPPLHYWLLWSWTRLGGDSEFSLRFPSAFLSLLLVPLMYQVGRKLLGRQIGLLAATLTSVHPQQIWLAQDARSMYLLALVGILIATWFLPNLLRHGHPKYWIGYVFFSLIAMYSHYYALFALIGHGGYVLAVRHNTRRWLGAGIAIAAFVAPWAMIVLPILAGSQLADPGHLTFSQFTAAVFGDLIAGPVFPAAQQAIIASVFGLIALVGLFAFAKIRLYLIAAVAIPFVGIYAILGTRSTFNPYYFIFAFPAVYLLLSAGIVTLAKRWRPIGLLSLALLTVIGMIGLEHHYFDPRYSKTRGLRDVAVHLAAEAQPGDGYLANFPDPVQGYYLRQLNLPYAMLPTTPNFDQKEIGAALSRLNYSSIWFVPTKASNWDRAGYVQTRLLDTALLLEDNSFDKMRLMLFVPPDRATPLEARFADGINLVGYALMPNRLTLVWQTTATPSANYTIFVHALASDGFLVAQHDAPPSHPTSTWQPRQLIIDIHEFTIPADQPITLVAGLYLPSTGQRLQLQTSPAMESDATRIITLNSGP